MTPPVKTSKQLASMEERRLYITPHVIAIVTQNDDGAIDDLVLHMKRLRECVFTNVEWRWSIVHMAALYDDDFTSHFGLYFLTCILFFTRIVLADKLQNGYDGCIGREHKQQLHSLETTLSSTVTQTNNDQIMSLLRRHLCVRLCRALNIKRLLLPDTCDMLVTHTFTLMCTGRGASIAQETAVIDKSYGLFVYIFE
jgi:hypothetical protein